MTTEFILKPNGTHKHEFVNASYLDVSVLLTAQCTSSSLVSLGIFYFQEIHCLSRLIVVICSIQLYTLYYTGPMKHTLADMWRIVWQEKCRCIVMVTNLMDAGKSKCEQYWPANNQDKEMDIAPFIVRLTSEIVLPDYIIRTIVLFVSQSSTL